MVAVADRVLVIFARPPRVQATNSGQSGNGKIFKEGQKVRRHFQKGVGLNIAADKGFLLTKYLLFSTCMIISQCICTLFKRRMYSLSHAHMCHLYLRSHHRWHCLDFMPRPGFETMLSRVVLTLDFQKDALQRLSHSTVAIPQIIIMLSLKQNRLL